MISEARDRRSNSVDTQTEDASPNFEREHRDSPSAVTSEDLWLETRRIVIVVGFYFTVSICLVFLNKNVMSEDFGFPLFVTWCQLLISIGCVAVLGQLGKSNPMFSMIPPFEFDIEIAQKVMPLAVIFVGMMAFNNLCLYYVEVTFYQVVRSLTVCFTILFTHLILGIRTSPAAIRASFIVVAGFIIGSFGEVNFSGLGLTFGVVSSCFVSLYSIYVKKIMAAVNGDQWKLLSYNTVLSLLLMVPFIWLSGEWEGLKENEMLWDLRTWVAIFFTGIFGFLINIAVFMQIKYTSPLTNNISGTLKSCIQTLFAMMIYKNPISFMNAVGIILVIVGSFVYSNVRYTEMRESQNTAHPLVSVSVQDSAKQDRAN